MSDVSIKHNQDNETGSFTANDGNKEIGMMAYNMVGPKLMSIYHTEVDEDAEGHGVGTQLVKAGIAFARESSFKIDPACEFAESFFEKNKDFADVLA